MKEFFDDLWLTLRYAVASVLCAIGYFVGLPGLMLSKVADLFIGASNFVAGGRVGAYEASDEDEDTDLVYT